MKRIVVRDSGQFGWSDGVHLALYLHQSTQENGRERFDRSARPGILFDPSVSFQPEEAEISRPFCRVRAKTCSLFIEITIYETGKRIQDASFHGQILLPRSLLTEAALREDYLVRLRTSNFGQLASVYDEDAMVRPDALTTMISVLEEHGCIYVPSAVPHEPYPGKNPGVRGFRTWGSVTSIGSDIRLWRFPFCHPLLTIVMDARSSSSLVTRPFPASSPPRCATRGKDEDVTD